MVVVVGLLLVWEELCLEGEEVSRKAFLDEYLRIGAVMRDLVLVKANANGRCRRSLFYMSSSTLTIRTVMKLNVRCIWWKRARGSVEVVSNAAR
jgi:hypothetical protein